MTAVVPSGAITGKVVSVRIIAQRMAGSIRTDRFSLPGAGVSRCTYIPEHLYVHSLTFPKSTQMGPRLWAPPKTHGLFNLEGIIRTAGYRHSWMHKCSSWNISANVPTGTLSHFARTARSIRRLARRVTSLRASRRSFLDQPIQFGASLADQRSGKRPGRPLPLRRQVLHPHVQQRNVLLKQSQSFLYARDAVISRKHGSRSPVSHQLATYRSRRKLQTEYLGRSAEETAAERKPPKPETQEPKAKS
jgi:hypothetical protein